MKHVIGKLKDLGKRIKADINVYRLVMKDPRTPKLAKILLVLAVGYAAMPFDLIPDFIPVIGHLDDLVIVTTLIFLAVKIIPAEVIADARRRC